ncbi:hypothetical protein KKA47_05425 [bacterium]|nr:hypothetical protein [bacterium]
MKIVGFILVTFGFIASAFLASIDKELINWHYYVPALIVGIVGVICLRVALHRDTKGTKKIGADINNVKESINNIVRKIDTFNQEKESIEVYDIHKKIDELFIDDINTFVEARKSIIHKYDMQSYADLMNHFAAGERYLNRSWSASADGYIDESYKYIEKSAEQFKITKEHFEQLK